MCCNGFSFFWQVGLGPAAYSVGVEPTVTSFLAVLVAVCLIAVAIRLMDDFIDLTIDTEVGLQTTVSTWREAALPYALAAFACSAAFAPKLAVSLFAAAYSIGMTGDYKRRLPLGLTGWQEAGIALVVNLLATGLWCMLWSLLFMFTVQACDDLIDRNHDAQAGCRNLCHRFGVVEIVLAALIGCIGCVLLSPLLSTVGVIAVAFMTVTMPRVPLLKVVASK